MAVLIYTVKAITSYREINYRETTYNVTGNVEIRSYQKLRPKILTVCSMPKYELLSSQTRQIRVKAYNLTTETWANNVNVTLRGDIVSKSDAS